jgi:hypothetical protein
VIIIFTEKGCTIKQIWRALVCTDLRKFLAIHWVCLRCSLVDCLWPGRTEVSELRALRTFCSSPRDLRCGPWMMILTEANSQLVYQSALTAPSTVRRSCQQRHLWQPSVLSGLLPSETSLERLGGGRRKWEFSLSFPVGLTRSFTCRKPYGVGPPALLPIRRKLWYGFLSPLKIDRFGRVRTRNLWDQWQAH